jgi:thermostable 8-oxoguanine DNA glycosylase
MKNNFVVTGHDIREASRCLHNDEIYRTKKGIFRGILFCLLSIGQLYKNQLNTYHLLLHYGFDSAEAILKNKGLVKLVVGTARFPKAMYGYVIDLAENWKDNEAYFIDTFIHNFPVNGSVMEVREQLIKRIKGFGFKVASLFLCLIGSDAAAIDIWCLRYLKKAGYDISYNSERKGGIDKKEYLVYESYMKQEAEKYGFSLAYFQVIVWVKLSSWNKKEVPMREFW